MRYIAEFDLTQFPDAHDRRKVIADALRDLAKRVEGYDFQHERSASPVSSKSDPDGLLGFHGYAETSEALEGLRDDYRATMDAYAKDPVARRAEAKSNRQAFESLLSVTDEDDDEPTPGMGR